MWQSCFLGSVAAKAWDVSVGEKWEWIQSITVGQGGSLIGMTVALLLPLRGWGRHGSFTPVWSTSCETQGWLLLFIRESQPTLSPNHPSWCQCCRSWGSTHRIVLNAAPGPNNFFQCSEFCPWSTPISFLRYESKYLCSRRNETYLSVSGCYPQHYMETLSISEMWFCTWENDISSPRSSFFTGLRHHPRGERASEYMGVLFSLCFFKHCIPLAHCCSIYYFNMKGPLSLVFVHFFLSAISEQT